VRSAGRHGPDLPYDLLAGVVPCRKGWLVLRGKLIGATLHVEPPEVVAHFVEVLDHVPSYIVTAVATPIGLADRWSAGGRRCDREARLLLGWPRLGAIASPPGRRNLRGKKAVGDVTSRQLMARIAEIDGEMQPYRQRAVYSTHPELSFFQLNSERPLRRAKQSPAGRKERRALVARRMAGIERVLADEVAGVTRSQLLDAAATLWTARRIAAKSAARVPIAPQWDKTGLRMEYVR